MEKRVFERVPEKVQVDFFYNNKLYEGTVTDLSCSGMQIDAEMCPPFESNLKVVLIMGDEVFELAGKVKRRVKRNELSGSMGIEVSSWSESYCEFVSVVQDYSGRKSFKKSE